MYQLKESCFEILITMTKIIFYLKYKLANSANTEILASCQPYLQTPLVEHVLDFAGTNTVEYVECYDPDKDEWLDATDMNLYRSAFKACVISDLPNVKDYTYYSHIKTFKQESCISQLQGPTSVL